MTTLSQASIPEILYRIGDLADESGIECYLVGGYVRDMIHLTRSLQIGDHTFGWPYVFNVADVYLVVGVAAVALAFLFIRRPAEDSESAKQKRA